MDKAWLDCPSSLVAAVSLCGNLVRKGSIDEGEITLHRTCFRAIKRVHPSIHPVMAAEGLKDGLHW